MQPMSHEPQAFEGHTKRAYPDDEPGRPGRDRSGIEVAEARFVPLIDDLHQVIGLLEERLVAVVKGERETTTAMLDSTVPPKRSPLAENLDARANSIQSAIVRLRQLEERIDL